jgi:hypothetical protein
MADNTPHPTDEPSSDLTPVNIDLKGGLVLLEALQAKLRELVEDFAQGQINRTQFHQLYDRYHRQMTRVMELTASAPHLASYNNKDDAENTHNIKKRLTARVLGMSIYGNKSGTPIETLGDFAIDPALIVPMLSSYRAATREIFKAGMRSTAMENGQWLCFVPGNYTTLIALFSVEPASMQMSAVEAMHRDFEEANKTALEKNSIDPSMLAYPFLAFVRKAKQLHTTSTHKTVKPENPQDKAKPT